MWGYIIDELTNRVAVFNSEPDENTKQIIKAKDYDVEKDWKGDYYIKGYAPKQSVDEAKSEKLREINLGYDTATYALVATYPQTELLTFDKQEAEARAWDADNSVETPLVDMLASGRQIDKAELVRRIIAKADTFALATGYLAGQRQRYEDLLDAATTVEAVAAIVPDYALPEGLSL